MSERTAPSKVTDHQHALMRAEQYVEAELMEGVEEDLGELMEKVFQDVDPAKAWLRYPSPASRKFGPWVWDFSHLTKSEYLLLKTLLRPILVQLFHNKVLKYASW